MRIILNITDYEACIVRDALREAEHAYRPLAGEQVSPQRRNNESFCKITADAIADSLRANHKTVSVTT